MNAIVQSIIENALAFHDDKHAENIELRQIEGFDSLTFVQLILEMERLMGCEAPPDFIENMSSLAEVSEFLTNKGTG